MHRGGKPTKWHARTADELTLYVLFLMKCFPDPCCPLKQIIPVYYADGQFLSMVIQDPRSA